MKPIPDYKNLDLSGEVVQAANRLEARARETSSQQMFEELILPLLTPDVRSVLEFGCGTAALSRRIAQAAPQALIYASDKSEGILRIAQALIDSEEIPNIQLQPWDIQDASTFPFPTRQFDLIISSVVVPYLDDVQTTELVHRLAAQLAPGGVLAFLEQDLTTDTINSDKVAMLRGVLSIGLRGYKKTLALGLRPLIRAAGLQLLPRRSFLWTDDAYAPYTRDLMERLADAAYAQGHITAEEQGDWKTALNDLAESGDFYYGIVYHLIAGQRVSAG